MERATSAGNFLRLGHFFMSATVTGPPSSAANCRYVNEIPSQGEKTSSRVASRSVIGSTFGPLSGLLGDNLSISLGPCCRQNLLDTELRRRCRNRSLPSRPRGSRFLGY